MDPITPAITTLLTAWGPLGAVVILAGVVIWKLYDRNSTLQDKRLEDVKQYAEKTSELARDLNQAVDAQTQALNSIRDLIVATSRTGGA